MEDTNNSESATDVTNGPSTEQWDKARQRANDYLAYLGIADTAKRQQLVERVLDRVQGRLSLDNNVQDDIPKRVVEEILLLLDSWLSTVSASTNIAGSPIESESSQSLVNRAALFFGRGSSYLTPIAFADFSKDEVSSIANQFVDDLRVVNGLHPVPAEVALSMDPQRLLFYRPLVGIKRFVIWLIGSSLRMFRGRHKAN